MRERGGRRQNEAQMIKAEMDSDNEKHNPSWEELEKEDILTKQKAEEEKLKTKQIEEQKIEREKLLIKQFEQLIKKYLQLVQKYKATGEIIDDKLKDELIQDSQSIYQQLLKSKGLFGYNGDEFLSLLGRAYKNVAKPTADEKNSILFARRKESSTTEDENIIIGRYVDEGMDLFYGDVIVGLPH